MSPPRWKPGCGRSTARLPAWGAVPLPPAPPATSIPKTPPSCWKAWAFPPGSTSARCWNCAAMSKAGWATSAIAAPSPAPDCPRPISPLNERSARMSQDTVSLDLGEDYPELRDSIRRICARYPLDYWAKLEETSGYPSEFVAELTEGGFLAALVPEEYGGAGLPLRAAAVILEEINANGCQASPAHAQMYIMGTLLRHGTEEQKQKYLPEIAAGTLRLQAFGVTEPTTGSDTTQLKTRAVRDGEHYVIDGQKVFTSRALYSDLMLLLARTTPLDQVAKKTEGISVFLVDLREARGNGIDIRPIKALMNHNTTEVFIENLRVPASALVGEEGKGFRYILDGMNAERILVASECIGDGRYMVK